MVNTLRIVFADCYDDSWIAPVAGDLYEATKTLGHELFVIGAGANHFVKCGNYINLDLLRTNIFSSISESLKYKDVNLTEQVNCEFLRLQADRQIASEGEIGKRLHAWLSEAIVLYKIIQPDIVIVWNGMLTQRAVYAKAARYLHIPLCYAEKGMLPDSWYIDQKGINALSTVAERKVELEFVEGDNDEWENRLKIIDGKGGSAWDQPAREDLDVLKNNLGIHKSQKVIFFPGQVDSDSNIVLFSNNFVDSLNALEWLVEGLPESGYFILAKPHPKATLTVKDYQLLLGNKGRALFEINVLDAIALADCVVSINSTVTFEAALRKKPVLLLGEGVLSRKDFVSNYEPGKDVHSQVMGCIQRYAKNKDEYFHNAVSFGRYLDSEYYTYRGNILKTLHLLERVTKELNGSKMKNFTIDEIAAFSQEASYENIKKWFFKKVSCQDLHGLCSGKILARALFEKVKDKFIKVFLNRILNRKVD